MTADEREESPRIERLPLEKAASQLLEECRMVLPGVQALLGFQLVAVFNSAFAQSLSNAEQFVHLAAMVCMVTAVALVMAPAAIHRIREPNSVSSGFIRLSSRLLMLGMIPLAGGTSADVYLIARVISNSVTIAAFAAMFCVATFIGLWVILPWRARLT